MNLLSIQVGKPQTFGDPAKSGFSEREWTTGFFKEEVSGPVEIGEPGISGDGQADLKVHGGPDKAVCVYPVVHFEYWRESLGLEMNAGAFGENFSVDGETEETVCVGDSFQVGEVVVQISQPRQPCWKLSRRWDTKNLAALVQQSGKTGWYFRVLQSGVVEAPCRINLLDRPNEKWTIQMCNQVMNHDKKDIEKAAELAGLPELSESWRTSLLKRVEGKGSGSEKERFGN